MIEIWIENWFFCHSVSIQDFRFVVVSILQRNWCLITKRVIELLQDQVKESKDHALQVFDHKSRVTDILHKYMSKRPVKKRDVKIMP